MLMSSTYGKASRMEKGTKRFPFLSSQEMHCAGWRKKTRRLTRGGLPKPCLLKMHAGANPSWGPSCEFTVDLMTIPAIAYPCVRLHRHA